jgi:uncharacterized protein (TIGR03067 family)
MKALSVAAGVLLAVVVAGWLYADEKVDAKSVLKQLEGKWKMDKMEVNGRENAQADRMGAVIDGDKITLTRDGQESGTGKLVLDPSKDPATVDWKWTSGSASGGTSLGIYEFKGDTLTICLNQARGKGSDVRPRKLTTKPDVGNGSILYVLKKQK